jgi:hypothetical protein
MRRIILFLFLCVASVLKAQNVYHPADNWQAYDAYRQHYLGYFRPNYFDPALNQFRQRLYYTPDTGVYLEIQIISDESSGFNKPVLKHFYKDQHNFYSIEKKDHYAFIINPVLHFESGKDDSGMLYQNKRGAEIKGNIGGLQRGIGFYSLFTENQAMLPYPYQYFTDSLNFVPNELFYKPFKKQGAVDYFQARGYITFNAVKDYVKFQFGHDKNKIGNGYRSLILSDFAPQYLFLKINTDVGRFHYQNLFTQFSDNGPILSNVLYGKKYGAFHRLSYHARPNLVIGVNEMVLFDRIDSTQMNQFDFNYLNPVIFYRSVESNLGSRDNSLMALDFSWTYRLKYQVYGQFLLDEFNLKFLKTQPDWWGNKYAYQLGARCFDPLKIRGLDVMVEYNRARPFTYSHMRPTQSYSHFNQALAHPLGSNFSELIAQVKYRVKSRLFFDATVIYAKRGIYSSLNGRNYGSNILRPYTTRFSDDNVTMYVGQVQELFSTNIMISYMLKHNIFVDARLNYRKITGSDNLFFTLGLRMNCSAKAFDY